MTITREDLEMYTKEEIFEELKKVEEYNEKLNKDICKLHHIIGRYTDLTDQDILNYNTKTKGIDNDWKLD